MAKSRTPAIMDEGPEAEQLEAMLTAACSNLAKAIARDGEGATCLIEVTVSGAVNAHAANQVSRTIAGSFPGERQPFFGHDPNWGRIAAAAGRSGVAFDQNDLRIQLGNFLLMEHGQPLTFDRSRRQRLSQNGNPGRISQNRYPWPIQVSIGDGSATGQAWGCDLSYDYVKINAEYTT